MNPRTARTLSWGIWGGSVLTIVAAAVLNPISGSSAGDTAGAAVIGGLIVLDFGTIGALIASRRPRNAIGWLFILSAAAFALTFLGEAYATHAAAIGATNTTLAVLADWLTTWLYAAPNGVLLPVFLLFPTGRPISPRWRPLVWAAVYAIVVFALGGAFRPATYSPGSETVFLTHNPYALAWVSSLSGVLAVTAVASAVIAFIGGVASLVTRLRRADGDERAQVRWLVYAAVLVIIGTALIPAIVQSITHQDIYTANGVVPGVAVLLQLAALAFVPVAVAIGILKYRLYDIDLVISKTVVFGLLAAFITAVYVAIVVGVGAIVGSGGSPVLSAIAAAVIALAFQPVRRWARRVANRLVYGNRATPYEVLAEFSDRLAGAYSTDDVMPRMAQIVAEGTGADRADVWLRVGGQLRNEACWPADAPRQPSVLADAPPDRFVPAYHQGQLLGALSVEKKPGDPLTPADAKLIEDLAGQAGLVLRNVGLLEDLRASRQRLVAAQDEERRRIERNIHDGAQQQLVALAIKQRLAASLVGKDDERVRAMLEELHGETSTALEDLRDLARGIYPPLLADKGLAAAIEAQARKVQVPIAIEADRLGRFPREVESAVYFSVLEALTNVAKYAGASQATVRLANGADGLWLRFEVADDGSGFDPSRTDYGTGLQGIADRLAALNGVLEVRSEPGRGTTLTGRLPTTEVAP